MTVGEIANDLVAICNLDHTRPSSTWRGLRYLALAPYAGLFDFLAAQPAIVERPEPVLPKKLVQLTLKVLSACP